IRRAHRDDVGRLLDALADEGRTPTHIVHLWTVGGEHSSGEAGALEDVLESGLLTLIALAQALGDRGLACALTIVSNAMCDVFEDESVQPEKATLMGACKVIPVEYDGITCRYVDLAARAIETVRPSGDTLLAELTAPVSDQVVALRGRQRWVQVFE